MSNSQHIVRPHALGVKIQIASRRDNQPMEKSAAKRSKILAGAGPGANITRAWQPLLATQRAGAQAINTFS